MKNINDDTYLIRIYNRLGITNYFWHLKIALALEINSKNVDSALTEKLTNTLYDTNIIDDIISVSH